MVTMLNCSHSFLVTFITNNHIAFTCLKPCSEYFADVSSFNSHSNSMRYCRAPQEMIFLPQPNSPTHGVTMAHQCIQERNQSSPAGCFRHFSSRAVLETVQQPGERVPRGFSVRSACLGSLILHQSQYLWQGFPPF